MTVLRQDATPSSTGPGTARLLIVGFMAVIGLLAGVSAVGLTAMTDISRSLGGAVHQQTSHVQLITRMRNSARERALLLSTMLITPDPFERDALFMRLRNKGEAFLEAHEALLATELSEAERAMIAEQDAQATRSAAHQYRVIELLHEERFEEATRVLLERAIPTQNLAVSYMDEFLELQQAQNTSALAQAEAGFRRGYSFIVLIGGAALLASALVIRAVKRRIDTTLSELEQARMQLEYNNEALEARVGDRTRALRLANESLRREIGERERAQAALARSEVRYRSFVEHFHGIAFQADLNLHPLFVHGAVESITGRTEEDFLDHRVHWDGLVHPGDRQSFLKVVRCLRTQAGFTFENEFRIRHSDGEFRCLRGFLQNVVDDLGRPQFIAGSLYDVTERKRADDALRRSEAKLREQAGQLAEADRRKDEFLAVLGHELRNPLAPIRHAVELLRIKRGGDAETVNWATEVIGRQAEQLTRLVDDLLVIARITRGRLELRREPTELGELMRHTIAAVRPLMEERGHRLHVELPAEPVRVRADPTRLEQIMVNLLNNAALYSDDGGRIDLLTHVEGGEARIRVRDKGWGMSAELLSRIFEPFCRGDGQAHAKGGLGLGLTLVRQLVEMHGGRIRASSAGLGQGSSFEISLPLLQDEVGIPTASNRAAAPVPVRALVVDDNPEVAQKFTRLLEALGHEVMAVADGFAALEAAHRFRPVLAFLDLGLPTMDGYELARRLRALYGSDVTLVAVTDGPAVDRSRAEGAGFEHHLFKPVELPGLEELLGGLSFDPGVGMSSAM